jgi:hypothetical protein
LIRSLLFLDPNRLPLLQSQGEFPPNAFLVTSLLEWFFVQTIAAYALIPDCVYRFHIASNFQVL